jgi:diguanylate cyclase (GGDEF)-like protein
MKPSAIRGRRRQLVLAVAIIVVAALTATSITALRRNADRARLVQVTVATLDGEAQRVSRIESEAAAEGRLSAELGTQFESAHGLIDRGLHAFLRTGAADARPLHTLAHRYLAAVEKQLALMSAGRVAESTLVDAREADPSFDALQDELDRINATARATADTASARMDIGVVASLTLAALGLIVMLARLDTLRSAAARRRERDLESQALQDALTGLPNRRKLLLDLEQQLLRTGDSRCFVVLCDLDGFKAYNDSFGHMEGDLLLARLGERLARSVSAHGTAYRFGGDEFCALLRIDEQELGRTLAACHDALSERGSGFDVRASIGAVAVPAEAADAIAALRLADQRMYAQKNTRDSSVGQQLRDLIMRVHVELDPTLHDHVHGVAQLAAGVGRALGLDDVVLADLVRAAELHDVGKIAIPDSILNKPGPLDPREQEFMRRHTLIGESILGETSALAPVGRLVRSSHERWDGMGYPDGLRAEEIPLASRIVFVCDAFDAMTTDRSYRKRMSDGDALEELERGAGTQFDPVVVAAFAAELAQQRGPQLVSSCG